MAWISVADHGSRGQPGSGFSKVFAAVKRAANGQYELHVRSVWGSNQGFLQEHGRHERRYRADTLSELMDIGISQIRGDKDFDQTDKFIAAIRDAIYDAQDTEEKPQEVDGPLQE